MCELWEQYLTSKAYFKLHVISISLLMHVDEKVFLKKLMHFKISEIAKIRMERNKTRKFAGA